MRALRKIKKIPAGKIARAKKIKPALAFLQRPGSRSAIVTPP
jgi:hypothetical protein